MSDYLDLLNERNQEIQASYAAYCAAQAKCGFASTLPDPKLNYSYYIQEVETRVGPQRQALGITQPIPWWGKLTQQQNLAERELAIAWQSSVAVKTAVELKLKLTLLDFHYVTEAISIQHENLSLIELIEETAKSRTRVGGALADVLQVNIEKEQLLDAIQILRERQSILIAQVNAQLNRDIAESIEAPDDILSINPNFEQDVRLQDANPNLLLTCLRVERQETARCLAGQMRYPDLAVGVNWIQTGRAINPTPDSGKDPVIASFSLTLPLWQSSYSAREQMECHKRAELEAQWQNQLLALEAEVRDIRLKYRAALREKQLYAERLLPDAEETLSILGEGYEAGTVDFERYLAAERQVLDYRLRVLKASVDAAKSASQYQAITGAV